MMLLAPPLPQEKSAGYASHGTHCWQGLRHEVCLGRQKAVLQSFCEGLYFMSDFSMESLTWSSCPSSSNKIKLKSERKLTLVFHSIF